MGLNRKRLVFFSRLLVIITIGYILVLTPGREAMRFWGYAFLAFYLSTNLILYYLPERYFNRPAFFYCIVLVDCILIVAGIYLTGMEGSDLYLVFFVILCLATLGSELKNLIIASFIFVIIYGWLLYQQGLLQGDMATSYCLRLPFILVVALFWGFIVDIQKRVQKEQLEETEEQYRSFINKLPVGTFQHAAGENGRFLLMNRAFVEMFGYDTKELEKTPAAAIYAEQKQKEFLYRALDEQGHVEGYPADLLRRDGSVFNSNIWARKYTVNEHEVVEGIIVDISELRQAERALAESEERLRLAGKASYDLVYEWRADDNRVRWFGDLDGKLGYSPGEISQSIDSWLSLMHPEDAEKYRRPEARRQDHTEVYACEYRLRHQDGSWRYWRDNSIPVLDENGSPKKWVGVCTDISRNKQMELQLQQAQKMEAIGVLAGGVAHNFNNNLMGIQGHISSMLMDKSPSDPDYEELKGIEAAIKEAGTLTKNLLGFARGGAYEVAPIDLNEMIRHESRIFASAKKHITLDEKLEENLWLVEADRNQIQQVFMNLYVNAAQAMPETEGGEIVIQTENVHLAEEDLGAENLPSGKYVRITVRDTGCGMEAPVLEKIFDPFFTTKKAGSGTGLGLSSVYGIIKNHAGFINVDSTPGKGTAFTVYIPATDKAVKEPKKKEISAKPGKKAGTILVVDDEEMVLKSCKRMLKRLNYETLTAQTGEEAISLYKNRGHTIDLVMLDILLPGMSGSTIFDRLREIDPDVSVLLCSGFSLNEQAREIIDKGCRGFIQKPFDIQDLSQKINEIMPS